MGNQGISEASDLLIRIEDLHTYFLQNRLFVKAVDGVTFNVFKNEVLGIVGESGSGKSVTALSMMGIPEGRPGIISGSITIDGLNILKDLHRFCTVTKKDGLLSIKKNDVAWEKHMRHIMKDIRGKKISMIFQEPSTSLDPYYRVGDQLREYITRNAGIKNDAQINARIDELLTLVNLDKDDFIKRYPHTLSGGQAQRVMIALALASKPALLIADEPTTYLDPSIQLKILELLKKLTIDPSLRLSLILISHDIEIIKKYSSRLMVMLSGRILEQIDKREYVAAEKHHPYTALLLAGTGYKHTKELMTQSEILKGKKGLTIKAFKGCRYTERCPHIMPEICFDLEPLLYEVAEGHRIRCHLFGKENS